MSKEKEDILKKGKKFFLLISIIVLSCSIIQATGTNMNDAVNGDVAGNGSGVNGTSRFDQDPNNNTITIGETGRVAGSVCGARNDTNHGTDVTSNTAVIKTTRDITGFVFGGYSFGTGNATNNKVGIMSGNIGRSVYGGYSGKGESRGNVVNIEGGTIGQAVFGGRSEGNATNNKVIISNVNITSNVYGGYSVNGKATENVVQITGGAVSQSVYGGKSEGNSTNNSIGIMGGNIGRSVYGGASDDGEAAGNVVQITGGTISQSVYGGKSEGNSTSNKVTISNGNITRDVYGGYSPNGGATGNVVEITGGVISQDVFGGWSENGEAAGNVVEITGGAISQDVFGGRSNKGNTTNNKVVIMSGNIEMSVFGGYSSNGEAAGNVLEITGGAISQGVYGGKSKGNTTNNKVVIMSGNIEMSVFGGYSSNGEAAGNVLEITGGAISQSVYGGKSEGNTTNNKVVIMSGNITKNVYGGKSVNGEAAGNEIEIAGSPTFSPTKTIIYGGRSNSGKESKRGNVLKMRAKGIEVLGIENFEAYKFYYPTQKGTPIVKVVNEVDVNEVKVSIEELDNIEEIEVGDRYVLIKSSSGIKGIDAVEILSTQEMLARYDYVRVREDNDELKVMVSNIEVNAKSKELTEARVGSMIFVGEGISREIGKEIQGEKGSRKVNRSLIKYFKSLGISRKIEKEILGGKGSREEKPFVVVVREGKSKYGNEIKEVGGVRVGGGIVKEIEKFGRNMVLGGYIEYGDGKYRSKEEIGGEVNSRGKSNYVGIGLKGEVEIKERVYGQIGMRIGRYQNDFESDDMGIGRKEGEEMKYDIEGMYRGVEVGGRYKVVEKENIGVEVKGEIGMMSMGGKEVKLTSGNKVDFKGVKIGKVRVEARGEYELKERVKPYVGLGCEYDKMWEVEASSGNLEIPSSHIEGISGIGEMGVEAEIGKVGIRCGCECYVGEREGIDGMLKIMYAI